MSNRIVINADQGRHTINRHIYGHFAEHLGRCIYDGIWVNGSARKDVVEALKQIQLPNLRWPGGCFADEYHWKDGIGPLQNRPSMINTHWGDVVEDNSFGTHEFLDVCNMIGCEPYICGNVGSGTVQEMSQWVEYVNSTGTPMAALREANGRKEPWNVRLWGVGNESWGCGGRMRPEYYADLYRRYGLYCRNYGGNRLFRVACGPSGANYHWTDVLMREAGDTRSGRAPLMDGLSLHYYTSVFDSEGKRHGSATDFGEDDWFDIMQRALIMQEIVERHSTIMDQYDPEKKVSLVVDEWGTWYQVEPGTNPRFLYQQNSIRDALVAGLTLNIFNNSADRVRIANLAQTVNVLQSLILTEPHNGRMLLTPTYHVFDMYKHHQDATLLPVDVASGEYSMDDRAIPQLSVSASLRDDAAINISICNTDPNNPSDIRCEIRGKPVSAASGTVLAAQSITAHNTFDNPEHIKPRGLPVSLNRGVVTATLPSSSVAVLEISV